MALLVDTTKILFFVDFSTEMKWHNKVVVVIEFGIFRFLTRIPPHARVHIYFHVFAIFH
jgi:hypothetical protein